MQVRQMELMISAVEQAITTIPTQDPLFPCPVLQCRLQLLYLNLNTLRQALREAEACLDVERFRR